ncbi:phenazine biosynthesis FMN-dependent oxidase PhzG [Streptomyces niveus]|uniref:Phenazine biosynthesis protein n=1 Tax=Streptomyces niveus TaxID=193462 RepID=A0A1U9QNE9_STRNV|nr:phenazine biosynthesis FMN-dependent oxidase PhzG [Streptomyces niveus]AQU65796.1 phenazine biosynthesis protein [Streptomyces niveus]
MSLIRSASRSESLTGSLDFVFKEYDDAPADPIPVLRDWLAYAHEHDVREPKAMALATANAAGQASTRIVVLNRVTDDGFVFETHSTSRKGRDIAETGWVSAVLYWRETGQQITVSGPARQLSDTESDALWRARPPAAHPMTTLSRQSEPLGDAAAMLAEAERLHGEPGPLPRPERYRGYQVTAARIEFWYARHDRLHQRLSYERTENGWSATRLQP